MQRVTVNVPPDATPDEEAELVARIAAAYAERDVVVEVEARESEEVDFKTVSAMNAIRSSRWDA